VLIEELQESFSTDIGTEDTSGNITRIGSLAGGRIKPCFVQLAST